ncbi:beta-ketoacyl synthase N-terminal-like domain-containing protein [Brevibacillus sp. SYSU BS000544]|uniref:beta-ketoacyl synthase N-terminal-like domain-containing protein n=1 Tax=Brevibacillus sp. SYSU BS000544 TaxID=3416443 RepID=UPI003CE5C3B1
MSQHQIDIAIVGLGCILPDACSPTQFWENNINGHTALRPLDIHNRWDWNMFYSKDKNEADKSYTITAGAIKNYEFDWKRFRIPPSEVKTSNPMQFMILDAGTQALEKLKVLPKQRTGIYIGSNGSSWQKDTCIQIHKDAMLHALTTSSGFQSLPVDLQERVIESIEEKLNRNLRSAADENIIVQSLASVACGRIAQYFDIRGPHVSIDAGYSSSLAALDVGVRSLVEGSVDVALVGGASEILTPLNLIAFAKLGSLSQSILRSFDAAADGTLLGEGTAMFALKRLEDAIRDDEQIYAVIKGIGSSSDGSGKSMVAPDHVGQSLAMKRAYEEAGIDPKTISYIECHATGTQVGDVSEIKALASFHQQPASCQIALGSVKANIGHLGAAAGAAGLLRAVLTLHQRQIPPQIHFDTPNPLMNLQETPFMIPTKPINLAAHDKATASRAAVSSFGFGGTNYHAVLEAYSQEYAISKAHRYTTDDNEPIAIIGMSGMFPDAKDEHAFWSNLLQGKDSIIDIPIERFDSSYYYDDSKTNPKKTYSTKGGFLSLEDHNPFKWKIPPKSAASIDQSHYLALISAEHALQDAGYDPENWNREKVSVMVGFLPYQNKKLAADIRVNYQEVHDVISDALNEMAYATPTTVRKAILDEAKQQFLSKLPEITEDTLQGYLGGLTAGRITKHFDFKGSQLTTDSACCSTHSSFLVGVQSLRHKKSDVVLVGGINADMTPEFYVGGCGIQALSAERIRPFDAHADGFVPGEGVGFFVLRRLSDAVRDGQKIHALIRSVASTSDGKSGSILAPSLDGESSAMIQALQQAGISPDQVDYVECHGTGTTMGDAVEVEAIERAYGANRIRPVRIGSVKSNIGHLLAAAAVPAVIKTVFALREGIIPPSINVEILNPKIEGTNGSIKVVTQCEEWQTSDGQPRRAGVSGFGLGGANSHMILEEYRPAQSVIESDSSKQQLPDRLPIATVEGACIGECVDQMLSLAKDIEKVSDESYFTRLKEMQDAINLDKCDGYRVAIVANHPQELARKAKLLATAISKGISPDFLRQQGVFTGKVDPHAKVGVVFPGQGVQYPNMIRDVMKRFPVVAEFMKEVDEKYRALSGKSLTATFFTDSPEQFQQTDEDIHCAVFAVNCAIFTLLRSYGLNFDTAIGQSAGELAALVAVEALSLQDALKAVRERTMSVLSLQTADPGKMMTIYCSAEKARKYFREVDGYCEISADNSPKMCIVSGETTTVQELRRIYQKNGIQADLLPVSHGYHSMMISHARKQYRLTLDACKFNQPKYNLISTITGNDLRNLPVQDYPMLLESQFVEPVRLRQAVGTAYESGVSLFVECGPKWAVSSFIAETLEGKDFFVQASLHPKIGEIEQVYRVLAFLFVHGKGQLTPIKSQEKRVGEEMKLVNEMNKEIATADLLFLKSLRDMIDAFLQTKSLENMETPVRQIVETLQQVQVPVPNQVPVSNHHAEPVVMQNQIHQPKPVAVPEPTQQPQPQLRDENSIREEVTKVLLSLMVQRTGYPEDMLDLDLDMEADLGIDTVKQVAILADARQHFGLEQEEGFRVRDYHTLGKVISYFTKRMVEVQSGAKQPAFFR